MSSLNNHLGEELRICPNQLAGHEGLCSVDQTIINKIVNLREQIVVK